MTIQGLKAFLATPKPDCDFLKLHKLLMKMSSNVTFWGGRVLTVDGEEGSVSLNALTDKVMSIIYTRLIPSNNHLFSNCVEKGEVIFVIEQLVDWYSHTDDLIAHANIFTKILAKIRNFSFTALRAYEDLHYFQTWGFPKQGRYYDHWPRNWA